MFTFKESEMGALPFIIRAKRAGVWARTKDYSRGEIGVDGLEILDILERI